MNVMNGGVEKRCIDALLAVKCGISDATKYPGMLTVDCISNSVLTSNVVVDCHCAVVVIH